MPSRWQYTLKDFKRYVRQLKTEGGKPLVIRPFQELFLRVHFGLVPEIVVVMPKGNGKTTILSALALFHMECIADADVIIAASTVRQARILFRQAAAMVLRSGLTQFEVKSGYGEIRYKGDMARVGPRIQVVAGEAAGEDGALPTLVLIDELHRHPNGDLYGVMRDGLGKAEITGRIALMVTISTAGADVNSPLGLMRTDAHSHESFVRNGCLNTAAWDGFAWFEWCLAEGDDVDDLELVSTANPLLSIESLRRRKNSPTMKATPFAWPRFACGLWVGADKGGISEETWDALRAEVGGVVPGDEVFVGIRIGAQVGIGLASPRGDGVAVKLIPMPAPVGSRVSLRSVEAKLAAIAEEYDVVSVVYDRDVFQRSAELLEEDGLPMLDNPQSVKKLVQATATFWRLVSGGLLSHDGDAVLRSQVLGARFKETQQGWRIDPDGETAGLVAVMVAIHEATDMPPQELKVITPSGVG